MMDRAEAIKYLEISLEEIENYGSAFLASVGKHALEMAIAALREPKRERGEWVFVYRYQTTNLEERKCSACKCTMHYYPWSERDNFCPCCGADMRPEGGAEG